MVVSEDADVNIKISAEDKASAVVQSSADRINSAYTKMHREQLAVKRGFELSNPTLVASARALQSVGRIAGQVTDVYAKYTLMQIRQTDAAKNVREAEEDYYNAIKRSGVGSEDAIRASRALADAQEDQKRATDENRVATVGLAIQSAGAISMTVTSVIPRLKELRAAMGLTTLSAKAMWTAILGPAGIALAAGAGAFAGFQAAGGDPISKNLPSDVRNTLDRLIADPLNGLFGLQTPGSTTNSTSASTTNNYYIYGADTNQLQGYIAKNSRDSNVYEGASN